MSVELVTRPAPSAEVSRRQVFAGAARTGLALGAVALAPVAVATTPALDDRHPARKRADEARAAHNARFWSAHREYRQVMADYHADESRWRVESWADRIEVAEHKMLLVGVSSASAIRAKLDVSDDPASYPLPGAAENLLQMLKWDLERMAMLEITGLAAPGELA